MYSIGRIDAYTIKIVNQKLKDRLGVKVLTYRRVRGDKILAVVTSAVV